jgi:hypothetical protein
MPARQVTEPALSPELEAIATAAAEVVHSQAAEGSDGTEELQKRVREAAGAAIASGAELDAVAQAQRIGQARARRELGSDLLRRVERVAKRRREIEIEYEDAIRRAARVGLPHREIADAAQVAHGTVRAIITRTEAVAADGAPVAATVGQSEQTDTAPEDQTAA